MAHQVMFPQQILDLQEEISKHPQLVASLKVTGNSGDFSMHLSAIGIYAGVILHGVYTSTDILNIATLLTKKLIEKRTLIILPGNETKN